VVKALRYYSDGLGIVSGGVTGDFFLGSFRQNHVPWGRLSLWKWVPGISTGVKTACACGWRPTTLVVPNVEMIRGLNLSGTLRATSVFRGTLLLCFTHNTRYIYHDNNLFFEDPVRSFTLFQTVLSISMCYWNAPLDFP